MATADCLIVMARFPLPGSTKTRLIPSLGAQKAAELHSQLVHHTLQTIRLFLESRECEVRICFAGGDASAMQQCFGEEFQYRPQSGESLGERMSDAVDAAFQDGLQRVVVIGTDCPGLTDGHLRQAFDDLAPHRISLGPAADGGYYLIGMKVFHPELFQDVSWGTDSVFQQTTEKAGQSRLTVRALPVLADIDHPEDLIQCRRANIGVPEVFPPVCGSLLSVIVPTLNEERVIGALLQSLKNLVDIEVIIADGGSTDRTREIATAAGATVVVSKKGRGRQMNAGAAIARGDVLLFVHADAVLPERFEGVVRELMCDPENAGGAFRLRLNDSRRSLRLVEWGANLRSRWFQLPYGDQGLFVRATTFFQMDGFRNWPLMEDYDFCQRLRRLGRIQLSSLAIQVSARRWNQLGIVRTTIINQLCVAGFRLGVPPRNLHRLYVTSRKSVSLGAGQIR